MTVSVVLAIAGCIALLFGIVGGGIKAKEIEVPHLSAASRLVSSIIGLVLLGFSIWSAAKEGNLAGAASPAAATPLPSPNSVAAVTALVPVSTDTPVSAPPLALTESSLGKLSSRLYEAKTWNVAYSETFEQDAGKWPMWNVDDQQKQETMQIARGVLDWAARAKAGALYFYESSPAAAQADFFCSARMRRIGGASNRDQAFEGLFFREHGGDFYAFLINDLLEYRVAIHQGDQWRDLVGWTKNPLIEWGQYNTLSVVADGEELYFYINGTPVETLQDATFASGNVGLLTGLNYTDAELTHFEFDDFEVRQKP